MNILVTGGSGTIGRFVCDKLLAQGHNVISFIRNVSRQLEFNQMTYYVGDISYYHDVQHAIHRHQIEGIIHCAANKHVTSCEVQPTICLETNLDGVINIVQSLHDSNVKRALFISTDKAAQPTNMYSMSKYLGERVVREYSDNLLIHMNSLRFGNVFGSAGSVIPIWLNLIRQKKDIELRTVAGKTPCRFAITPDEVSDFILKAFSNYNLESGSVVFPECNIIDMRILAEIMIEHTSSSIIETDMSEGENFTEMMYNIKERNCLKKHSDMYEISKSEQPLNFTPPKMTTSEKSMNRIQTREFYKNVKSQLKL